MVYKPRLKSAIKGPCESIQTTKRLINQGASIEQNPWQPTKRKGHINAENKPGHPSYKIIPTYLGPNVIDSKKKSAPAYSLAKKIIQKSRHIEVGPASFDISGLCNRGLQKAPAYSLASRKPDIQKFQAPAANKYSLEKTEKATTKTVPNYSFGKKPKVFKPLTTPAPNVYNLPPVFGTAKEGQIKAAPAFTMPGRVKPREIPAFILPGPGEYDNNYRCLQKLPPRFSLRSKHKIINDEHTKPGPAAHCPEKYYKHKSVPAPSFSIRHTPYLGLPKAHLITECKPPIKPPWIL